MRTVRRLYLYTVAFVSLEVVLWGLIGLARSIFCPERLGCTPGSVLARGLALVLVGLPVLALHWWLAQRLARRELEEQASPVRAVFLYGVLLATLIPAVQNTLALVNRAGLELAGLRGSLAFVGGFQSWSDNLIAIGLNLVAAGYFLVVLRADCRNIAIEAAFSDIRRLYRILWTLYGLGLTLIGLNHLLRFILTFGSLNPGQSVQRYWAINGTLITLVAVPVWVAAWSSLQKALPESGERSSLLRLALLYLLALGGAVTVLASAGLILNQLLRFVFAGGTALAELLDRVAAPLSLAISFGLVWSYYGHRLRHSLAQVADLPRREGMRRVYLYILSALGLGTTFVGLALLLKFVIDRLTDRLSGSLGLTGSTQLQLAAALATLLSALPVWLSSWSPLQEQALTPGTDGDHARRSILRKVYLYLALFAGVVGGMASAIALLYSLLNAALAGQEDNLLRDILNYTQLLLLFGGLGTYHGLLLGGDNRMASAALAEKHAAFPVLLLDPGGAGGQDLQALLAKQLPRLPVRLLAPDEALPPPGAFQAVLLSASQALEPPETLRRWLAKFNGARILVPSQPVDESPRWFLVGQTRQAPLAQAVQVVRQLAEGQKIHAQSGVPGWQIVFYILLALVGIPFLISLINLAATSTAMR